MKVMKGIMYIASMFLLIIAWICLPTEAKAENTVLISSWSDFEKAMETDTYKYVQLIKDIEYEVKEGREVVDNVILEVNSDKVLDLNGKKITVRDKSNVYAGGTVNERMLDNVLFSIDSEVLVKDSAGNGKIRYEGGILGKGEIYKYCRRTIFQVNSGQLTIDSGTFEAGNTGKHWDYSRIKYVRENVLGTVAEVNDGGVLVVNDGKCEGRGREYRWHFSHVIEVYKGGKAYLNGGHFVGERGAKCVEAEKKDLICVRGGDFKTKAPGRYRVESDEPELDSALAEKASDCEVAMEMWEKQKGNMVITDWLGVHIGLTGGDKLYTEVYDEVTFAPITFKILETENCVVTRIEDGVVKADKEAASETIWDPSVRNSRLTLGFEGQGYYETFGSSDTYKESCTWEVFRNNTEESNKVYQTTGSSFELHEQSIAWENSCIWKIRCTASQKGPSGTATCQTVFTVHIAGAEIVNPSHSYPQQKTHSVQCGKSEKYEFQIKIPEVWSDRGTTTKGKIRIVGDGETHMVNGKSMDLKDYVNKAGTYEVHFIGCVITPDGEEYEACTQKYTVHVIDTVPQVPEGISYSRSSSKLTICFYGELNGLFQQNAPISYQWQKSKNGTADWTDIAGATKRSYTPSEEDAYVRAIVRVEGYEGELVGSTYEFNKVENLHKPEEIQFVLKSNGTVTILNYQEEQEYVYSDTLIQDMSQGIKIEGDTFRLDAYGTYNIYTRYKETAYAQAGTNIVSASVSYQSPGAAIMAYSVRYPDYPNTSATIHVPLGETVTVDFCYEPSNANSSLPDYMSENTSVMKVVENAAQQELEITGLSVGSANVRVVKAGTTSYWQTAQQSAYTLRVVVFDPEQPDYSILKNNAIAYPDYTLEIGERYVAESPDKMGVDYVTEGFESTFDHFRWYLVKSGLTGASYVTETNVAKIDPVTGDVTALSEGTVSVYAFALKEEDALANAPLTSTSYPSIGSYKLTVVEDGTEIPVERVIMTPGTVELVPGKTYQLQALKSPVNAGGSSAVTWKSNSENIVTVDANGMITAVAEGRTTVEATIGGVTGACAVTVYDSDHAHAGKWTMISSEKHERVCTECDLYEAEKHNFAFTVEKEATCTEEGWGTVTCIDCGYGEYKVVPPYDHPAIAWEYDEEQHVLKCSVCKETLEAAEAHTLDENGACTKCPHKGPHTHTYDEYVYSSLTHWKLCTDDECPDLNGSKMEEAAHVYDENEKCTVCEYSKAGMVMFDDVEEDDWFYFAVLWAVEKRVTSGLTATKFGPDEICTRAQAVTFLWRAAGSPEPVHTEMAFKDVKEGSYYYKPVLWAVEENITTGLNAESFGPDEFCTRGQIVTFLWRSQGSPEVEAENPFDDVPEQAYYTQPVLWAVENGITLGFNATTFSPGTNCTRAQIVTFLYRCD